MTAPSPKEIDFRLEQAATPRALADPAPGPLASAFLQEDIEVCGFHIRPVMAGDWVILKKINSPIYRMSLEMDPAERMKVEFTDDDAFEIIYQFTRPASEVRAALKKGREAFTEAANKEIGDNVVPTVIPKLVEAIREQLNRSYATSLKFGASNDGEGSAEVKNFPEPPYRPGMA